MIVLFEVTSSHYSNVFAQIEGSYDEHYTVVLSQRNASREDRHLRQGNTPIGVAEPISWETPA